MGCAERRAGGVRDASADPLVIHEAELLQHPHTAHGEQLGTLCGLLGERADRSAHRPAVVPLALDRLGLRVRLCERDGRCFDARFDFPGPVRDVTELRHAMHTLFEAAAR